MTDAQRTQHPLDLVPDAILAGRAADGDTNAFEALARRHGPLMRASARRLTGSWADADDVVQESLVQAWKQLENLRDHAAVRSWLLRIVGSRSVDHLRKRRNHADLESSELQAPQSRPQDPEPAALNGSGVEALKAALAELPEEQRRCWVLKEFTDQSYEEIAATLKISPASVRGRLARARITLARRMEEWSTSRDTLECGHSLAELSAYLDTGEFSDPAHLESCPECQSGLATLRRLSTFAGDLMQADLAEAGSGADDWMQSILSNLRLELRPGRTIPLHSDDPADALSETEGAVTALIRSLVDGIPGTAAGKCRLLGDVTEPGAGINVHVDVAVVYGHHLEERATEVRGVLADALRTQTELNITGIDVTVTDVLDPAIGAEDKHEEQP